MRTALLLAVVLVGVAAFSQAASAETSYPVAELGNCGSEAECSAYCEEPDNMAACLSFAEKNGLASEDDIADAKKFAEIGNGPGNCGSLASCEEYCNDISHVDECIAFGESSGMMSAEGVEDAKKVKAALEKGLSMPGGCKTKGECDAYCSDSGHMEECITFAEAAGFIPQDELEDAKKMLEALKRGVKPPPCKGKKECDFYCSQGEHLEECITFAEAAGMIPADELAEAKKALQAIKNGAKLPDCRGKKQCDAYCSEEAHFEECLAFSVAAGFISEEEAANVRKTGGKGPGGCKSKETCDSFCKDPANQETCYNFGVEHGLMSEADIQRTEEGKRQMQESLNSAPSEVVDCMVQALGQDKVDGIRAGTAMPSQYIGDVMSGCYQRYSEQQQQPGEGMQPDGEGTPPSEEGTPPGEEQPGTEQQPGTEPGAGEAGGETSPDMPPGDYQPPSEAHSPEPAPAE